MLRHEHPHMILDRVQTRGSLRKDLAAQLLTPAQALAALLADPAAA